ncbi:MAG: Clp protease N-terminal domain-containing protein [Planctomycetota bacterium]
MLANQQALQFGHAHVGVEHLLLGLLEEGAGTAHAALANLDVDTTKLRSEIQGLMRPGAEPLAGGLRPQTPEVRRAILDAIEWARQLGHDYVGSEHLLLGIVSCRASTVENSQSPAAGAGAVRIAKGLQEILAAHGLTPPRVGAEIVSLLGGGETAAASTGDRTSDGASSAASSRSTKGAASAAKLWLVFLGALLGGLIGGVAGAFVTILMRGR